MAAPKKSKDFKSGMQLFVDNGTELYEVKSFFDMAMPDLSQDTIDTTTIDQDEFMTSQYSNMKKLGESSISLQLEEGNTSHDDLLQDAIANKQVTIYVGSAHSKDLATKVDAEVTLPTTRDWYEFNIQLGTPKPPVADKGGLNTHEIPYLANSFNRTGRVIA